MDPSVYIPAYLERAYLASHPELTDAARELVHNDVSVNPHKYAQTEHAQALLSYPKLSINDIVKIKVNPYKRTCFVSLFRNKTLPLHINITIQTFTI